MKILNDTQTAALKAAAIDVQNAVMATADTKRHATDGDRQDTLQSCRAVELLLESAQRRLWLALG